jgi:hypothetical protein
MLLYSHLPERGKSPRNVRCLVDEKLSLAGTSSGLHSIYRWKDAAEERGLGILKLSGRLPGRPARLRELHLPEPPVLPFRLGRPAGVSRLDRWKTSGATRLTRFVYGRIKARSSIRWRWCLGA